MRLDSDGSRKHMAQMIESATNTEVPTDRQRLFFHRFSALLYPKSHVFGGKFLFLQRKT